MRPSLRTCVLGLAATAALAGCGSSSSSGGSSNGVASKSADQILAQAKTATSGAKSVHVSGSTVSNGTPVTLDLSLVAGQGGTGTFSQSGLSVQLIATSNTIYLNGTKAFWEKFGGAAAAQLLAGKWLKASASNSSFAGIAQLADFHKLIGSALDQHGSLAKGGTSTVNGQSVVGVKDTTQGGTLYVATTGQPYPVQLAKTSGADSGKLNFDKWNQTVTISPPSSSIDLSQLKGFK